MTVTCLPTLANRSKLWLSRNPLVGVIAEMVVVQKVRERRCHINGDCCDARWHCRGDVKKALTFAGYKKAFGTAAAKVAEQMCKGVGKGQSLAADFILMWKVENLPFQIAIAHRLMSS
ncbi:hypothetical protein QYF36_008634 [Acer negundo]|nr:hypothetical protein QYF36_008634 [Acer negundo]